MSEQPTIADLLIILMVAGDERTLLIIGEVVKDGKRTEVVRKRASMINVATETTIALRDIFQVAAATPALSDPDEVVVRVLRPVKE